MVLAGTNRLLKTSILLKEVATITTTNRPLHNNSKLTVPQPMDRAMVTAKPTVKDKVMVKMVTVVIMLVQRKVVMASHSRTKVLDTTRDTVLPTAMHPIRHLMATLLHTEHKVIRTKPLHNPARNQTTHHKVLPSPVTVHPHRHRVATVPNHPMEVTGQLRLKNPAVRRGIHSHSSLLVVKAVVMLSRAMVNRTQVLRDLHRRLTHRLNQGMVPHLTEHHQQLKVAMANSSRHSTVAQPMVAGILSHLRRTLLM